MPEYARVDTGEALGEALDRQAWDVIFSDYTMPSFSGTQALALVRERGIDAPFIFVSGTLGEDTAVASMKAGAHDYIMKNNTKRLLPAVARELREAKVRRGHQRAETERREAEARFRNVLEIAAEGIISVDESQQILIFNRGAEQIFGYQAEEVLGKPLDVLLPERYVDVHREHVRHFASGPEPAKSMNCRATIRGRRKDGSEFPAEASISKLTQGGQTLFTVILHDISARKQAEERIYYLAHHDVLTGLPNRTLLQDRLQQAIIDANRHDHLVAVLLLDMDRFKIINDTLGHDMGDQLLRKVSERLATGLREGDTVARIGGDEFVIVLQDTVYMEDAGRVARKILDQFT
ncbi:MAG: diguanylate cyclase, partial [Gammaproteobacteria bacterium]|nr:diguanylate cyclase [Gammaproteobacteria bacterium]